MPHKPPGVKQIFGPNSCTDLPHSGLAPDALGPAQAQDDRRALSLAATSAKRSSCPGSSPNGVNT
jgi:hypothetical protein